MKAIALSCAALAMVTGCATSPGNMKSNENKASATVSVPYQLALKRIVDNDRECMPTQLLPVGQVINDVQNYPDLRMGSITKGSSGIGTQIYQVIEVREVDPASSEIVLFTKSRRDQLLTRLTRWANGGSGCES